MYADANRSVLSRDLKATFTHYFWFSSSTWSATELLDIIGTGVAREGITVMNPISKLYGKEIFKKSSR